MKLLERVDGVQQESECTAVFTKTYDIIVCGAGTAGIIAGITAARMGASVLCVEIGTFLGGMGTGIVMGYYNGDHLKGQCSVLDEEIVQLSDQICSGKKAWCEGIHAEAKKLVYEAAYTDAGGTIWYESMACGVWQKRGLSKGCAYWKMAGCRMLLVKWSLMQPRKPIYAVWRDCRFIWDGRATDRRKHFQRSVW